MLLSLRPVIFLDATHLCSEFKGTLYVASVLTPGDKNNVFPIGFMIASNEDRRMWVQMLTYLKEACPIVCLQGQRCQDLADDDAPLCETPFVFGETSISNKSGIQFVISTYE
jgi:hypothetical protein